MKRIKTFIKKKPYFLPVVAGFTIVGAVLTHAAFGAGAATLTLTPASGSYDINTNFTVTVKENSSSETINAVQADLAYDSSKLQFISLSTAGNFNYCDPSSTGGGGNVSFACASTSGALTGQQTVGTVTFKVLAGSGSTNVTFKSSSAVVRTPDAANVWNGSSTGGTYTMTTPATPTCPAGQTGTPPNCTTPPSGGGGGGTSSGGGGSTSTSNSTKTGSNNTTPTTTTPTTPTDTTTQPVTVGENGSVSTGGLVSVRVVDDNGQPIAEATVTIGDVTAKTDKTGVASFTSIKPGKYTVVAKTSKGQVKAAVTVKSPTSVGQVQSFDVKVKSSSKTVLYLIGGLAVGAALLGAGYFLFTKFKGPGGPDWFGKGNSKMVSGSTMDGGSSSSSSKSELDDKLEKIESEKLHPSTVITPHGD